MINRHAWRSDVSPGADRANGVRREFRGLVWSDLDDSVYLGPVPLPGCCRIREVPV